MCAVAAAGSLDAAHAQPPAAQAQPAPLCATSCRALETAVAAYCATLSATLGATFSCAADAGGTGGGAGPCMRDGQPVGGHGGQVKPSCAAPEPRIVWSEWLSHDAPSGEGDFETLRELSQAEVGCAQPLQIEARSVGGTEARATGQVLTVHPAVGLVCKHSLQPAGTSCLDYQVRFGCEQPTLEWAHLTQAWHEDTTRSGAGVLVFVPTRVPLSKTRFRAAMTFAPNNGLQVLRLAADNNHYFVKGGWSRTGNVLAVQYQDRGETMIERYDVLELGPGVLRLKKQ